MRPFWFRWCCGLLLSLLAACQVTVNIGGSPPAYPVPPPATPTAAYGPYVGLSGYQFITTGPVGNIPAGAAVRLSYSRYDGKDTLYGIVAQDERTTAEARESQLTFVPYAVPSSTPPPPTPYPTATIPPLPLTPTTAPPLPTPKAAYSAFIGMGGYPLVLVEAVDGLPAGARVRVSHAYFDGEVWVYAVVGQDERAAVEVREGQLILAPDVTPGPTPTR